ncbi:MAG: hypothetical protein ACFFA8_12035 [Promethearchaeota archaeon]
MKIKRSRFFYLLFSTIIIILLISSFIYVTHIKEMYRTGTFFKREYYDVSYSDGNGGITAELILNHNWYDSFYVYLRFTTTSNGDVESVGINSVNYSVFLNDDDYFEREDNLLAPELSYEYLFFAELVKKDEISCIGFVNVSFLVESVVQNEIIDFEINYIMPVSFSGIYYELDFPLYLLQFLLIILIAVSSLIIIKIIRSIILDRRITDKSQEKDEKFYSYVRSKIEKHNEE